MAARGYDGDESFVAGAGWFRNSDADTSLTDARPRERYACSITRTDSVMDDGVLRYGVARVLPPRPLMVVRRTVSEVTPIE